MSFVFMILYDAMIYCMICIYFDIFTSLTNVDENYLSASCFENISGKFKKRVEL